MKNLLAVCIILFGLVPSCFGATFYKANFIDPDYQVREDGMYNRLGFGSLDATLRFMSNQVTKIAVGIYEQDGSGGFGDGLIYEIFPTTETLDEAILRVSNTEFNRKLALKHYRTDQMFSLKFNFANQLGIPGVQFYTQKVYFTPEIDGTGYKVPDDLPSRLELLPASVSGVMQGIYWNKISRAALVVYDENGKCVYSGDTGTTAKFGNTNFYVTPNLQLVIARRFTTNHTGVLNVALDNNATGTYLLRNGELAHPYSVPPTMALTLKNGVPSVEICGGTPNATITLKRFTDLNCPPQIESLTLNCVGSYKWSNSVSSNLEIYSVSYDD